MNMRTTRQSGVALIEVVVAIGIIATIVVAVGFSVNTYVTARSRLLTDLKTVYLAEEGYEIIRGLRDNNWSTLDALPTDTKEYLSVSTTSVGIGGGIEVIDGQYYREFVLQPVYRNASDDVVDASAPGATVDPEARIVSVSVGGPSGTSTFSAILANLHAI